VHSTQIQELEAKIEDCIKRTTELNLEMKTQLQDEEERNVNRHKQLFYAHKEEFDEFEKRWNDVEILKTFVKPS
jgi:hypothetical protein